MSGSPDKKYSTGHDYNHPKPLADALATLNITNPENPISQFKTARPKTISKFVTHTIPDITPKTRIIAVLGIEQKNAGPGDDGWFLSDFFAFWHVLNGFTSNQTWLHGLKLDELIKQHQRYLHGSPFKTRKVVLDAAILDRAMKCPHAPKAVLSSTVRLKFAQQLKKDCQEAEKAKESVLVLMFGHGAKEKAHYAVSLGTGYKAAFGTDIFKNTLRGINANITILSTACFSGGWACEPDINATILAAAGKKGGSHSWQFSGSSGRACGSVFTTAIVDKLTKIGSEGKSIMPDVNDETELTGHQEESYAAFVESVYENLLKNIDQRGWEHGLTFSAQDDAWAMCWRERTGIPLNTYRNRWAQLEDWPADETLHFGDVVNRDPYVTAEQREEFLYEREWDNERNVWRGHSATGKGKEKDTSILGKRKLSGLYGGTLRGLINHISAYGQVYLDSYQGRDDTGDDGALHNLLHRIQSGDVTDMESLERAHDQVRYRMEQMSTTDNYLSIMDLPRPKNLLCHEYDTLNLPKKVGEGKYSAIEKLIDQRNLFPDPVKGQGRPFYKGPDYLIAAFHSASLSKEAIEQKLDIVRRSLNEDLELDKEIVKKDPEVTSKRRRLYQAFNVALGNMSPTKRHSRGQSMTT